MSVKLRILGLGLLAVMATGAVAVMNATADTGGHFSSSVTHTSIVGTESGEKHQLHFKEEGAAEGSRIGCINDSYTGTVDAAKVESITITPSWSTCTTTNPDSTQHFEVTENGCQFTFTIGDTGTHHTADLVCPPEKAIEIHHPNCTITVPPQTVTGVVYTADTAADGKKTITLDSTVKDITSHYHGGICIFLGTKHESEMNGSVTVEGFDTEGKRVDITATTK
ncbi:MAG TPA: hypothetical protein VF729_03840 [Solirubrobacterales bacterium]